MKKSMTVARSTAIWVVLSLVLSPAWASASDSVPADGADAMDAEDTDAPLAQGPDAAAADDAAASDEVALSDDAADAEESRSLIDPFSVSFSVTDTFSLGSVFRDRETVTNYNLLIFGLSGSYRTPVPSLSTSVSLSLTKYTSNAGGSVNQREARFGDIGLGISYGSIWSDPDNTGLNLSGSLGGSIPTSDASRFTNLRTRLSLGFGLSRSFGDLTISFRTSASKNFHRDTSVVADLDDFQLDIFARDGGSENIGEAQIALDTGVLSEWGWSNALSLSYVWLPGFSTGISFSLNNNWTYDNGTITERDTLTSPNANPGRGHGQSMTGAFSASYGFLDYFAVGAELSTSQPVKTADNQSVRFPFFDLETGNLQNTSFALTLSASY